MIQRTLPIRAVMLAVVASAMMVGCASVDHVRSLREARATYNDATSRANTSASRNLMTAAASDLRDPPAGGSPVWSPTDAELSMGFGSEDLFGLHAAYNDAALQLADLNSGSRSELIADKLYGSSRTLQLLCEWKAAFFARLLGVDAPDPAGAGVLPETPAMTELRARRRAVLADLQGNEASLFPRDQLYLAALEPLLRYDNAYIYAVEYSKLGKFDAGITASGAERLAAVREIVEEMAQAEEELASIRTDARHTLIAISAAREMMLRTAVAIVLQAQVNRDPGLWRFSAAERSLPRLTARLLAFGQGCAEPGDPLNEFLAELGIAKTRDDALALIGTYWAGGTTWPSDDD